MLRIFFLLWMLQYVASDVKNHKNNYSFSVTGTANNKLVCSTAQIAKVMVVWNAWNLHHILLYVMVLHVLDVR